MNSAGRTTAVPATTAAGTTVVPRTTAAGTTAEPEPTVVPGTTAAGTNVAAGTNAPGITAELGSTAAGTSAVPRTTATGTNAVLKTTAAGTTGAPGTSAAGTATAGAGTSGAHGTIALPGTPANKHEEPPAGSLITSSPRNRAGAPCDPSSEDEMEKALIITVDEERSCSLQRGRVKGTLKRKRGICESRCQEVEEEDGDKADEDEVQPEVEIDQELDRVLENKSKQHNLTSANVRSIIHEVITNEHVVAMMKAAINETEPVPVFEPKMTRSKLKEVVEKGVVIPTWNISPIKKPSTVKGPQFVDIPLEEEDSSDEEYQPDEEEEDETAEETLLESDLESTASSPRGTRQHLNRSYGEHEAENSCSSRQQKLRHVQVEVVPMGPPPPPQGPEPPRPLKESTFMEKLYAVDEELAIGTDRMDYRSLTNNGEESLVAFRTRSKRPLRNVPLGRLEAELRAPDITPDMYEFGSAPEDREWTQWLQGLMNSDVENEEEGDDEDDPEYNFLADIDEPDVEDYRNDKAVRITKKEVNELMEELFDAFQDELGGADEEGLEEEEEKEEDDTLHQAPPSGSNCLIVLETIRSEDPLADVLNNKYSTVKKQLTAISKRKAFLESKGVSIPTSRPSSPPNPVYLFLSPVQKLHLQQHIQQHVQLLTQINMLSGSQDGLQMEAHTTRHFLSELQFFGQRSKQTFPGVTSIFQTCNLQPALSLLEDLDESGRNDVPCPVFPGSEIPSHLAWLMATRSVFLYPELLPTVMLRSFHYKSPFTPAEDCLVVLGHQHMKGTSNPLELTCQYLLAARNLKALRHHMYTVCRRRKPNVIKTYFLERKRVLMPLACGRVSPSDQCPPVEKDQQLMPCWLLQNLQLIHKEVQKYNLPLTNSEPERSAESSVPEQDMVSEPTASNTFTPGTRYPHSLPNALASAAKLPPRVHCRKRKRAQRTEPPKPPPSAKDVEEALSRLPHILPKLASFCETSPPLRVKSRRPPQVKTVSKSRRGRPPSKRGRVYRSADLLTLPSVPGNPEGIINDGEGHIMALDVHKAVTTNANIIMALPAAVIHPSTIAKVIQSDTPLLEKENMNQRCGTLLKLGLEQKLNVDPLPVSHEHFIILPPGCIITDRANDTLQSLNDQQEGGAVTGNAASHATLLHHTQQTAVRRTDQSHIQESVLIREEDETMVTEIRLNEEKPEELESELFKKPFLTLSESSGSPTPSVPDKDLQLSEEMEVGGEYVLIHPPEQKNRRTERQNEREKGSVANLGPDLEPKGTERAVLQGENFTAEKLHLFYDDLSDADPRRDIKDVAFAHAYLEKVCEALQAVPGKVEEFLSILYEFERNPEERTATELFMRLKPILWEWPELLRDFAAFLHPEQAQECDLLAEQQAFERSKRFLRQLELCFGEGSVHYRKVVRTLQQGLPKSLQGSEEIKAQISMLFLNNADLLDEYWAFYAQLHPSMQHVSDDEDEVDHAHGVSCVDMVRSADRSPQLECIKPFLHSPKTETVPQSTTVNLNAEPSGEGTKTKYRRSAEGSHHAAAHSPVCAQNSSHTQSGEKVVLWTREADRVILTMCQQKGACRSTFSCVAAHLGNKTSAEVSDRYQDLIKLFHKSTERHDAAFDRSDEEPD